MPGCEIKMKCVFMAAVFLLLAVPARAFQVSMFVPRDDTVFWSSLVRLTRTAADDLGVDLTVYNAANSGDTMLSQVKTACIGGSDAILVMNYENRGREYLAVSNAFRVPAFLYNSGFSDPALVPRKQFPLWVGSMTPDDVRAGGLLAERLIDAAKRPGNAPMRMLAIEGNPLEQSSIDRVAGMKAVLSGRHDVTLIGIANAGKTWSRAKAKEVFQAEFSKDPEINIVWAAGDDIALGVLDAMIDLGIDPATVTTGGIDWSVPAVESIRDGHNRLSIGGHILEGAWALILMYDYLHGIDFSRETTTFRTRMHAIDSHNVDQVSRFLSDTWDRIDFKRFSKHETQAPLYRFELPHVLDTYYPATNGFTLTDEEQRWLADHPTIRLGIDSNWPPFESLGPEGHYQGMVADYIHLLEARLGITFVYTPGVPWSETLTALKNKRLDMISAIATLPRYRQDFRLTAPFLSFPLVVITSDKVDFIEDMAMLRGRKVAVVKDYSSHKILTESWPEINVHTAGTTAQALRAVATGKAYAYLGNLAAANHAIKEESLTNLKVSGAIPRKLDLSMAVRKDWQVFEGLVTKALNSITEEERDAIYQRWAPLRYEHGFDYTLLWKLGALAAFVLSVSIYWNRRLSLVNKKLKEEIHVRLAVEEALRKEQETVKQLAVTDPLTGLFNRRKLMETYPLEVRRLRRSGRYLAFVIMDIDYFKQYNDHYGHQQGDVALSSVARRLHQRCKRATDTCYRLGGEEFGILFLARDHDRALAFVEKMRLAIVELGIEHQHNKAADSITVSCGLVVSDTPPAMDTMYKAADQALYRAKEAGRNKTETAGII